MNLVYNEIGSSLAEAVNKGYRGGLAAVVKMNKKTILRLQETSRGFAEPLFKISYTGNDERLLQNFEVEAFTVAGVLNYEAEEKLKAMAKSIIDGSHPYLKAHPESDIKELWQDEAYNILADYIEVPDMPPPGVLNTNLRTAVTDSYHAAQWQRLQELKDIYPAYRYKTRNDARVRDEHRILHDKVFMANDPIWDTVYPENSWNCRCYVEPLGYEELGEVDPKDRVSIDDEARHKEFVNIPDKDFRRNSGKAEHIWGKWLETKFKDLDYNKKFKEVFDYSRSVGRYQEKGLLSKILEDDKAGFVKKELTAETWEKEFPGNEVETPFGKARFIKTKQWESQFEKLLNKEDGRYKLFGIIKNNFNDPSLIIKDAKGGLIFVKQYKGDKQDIVIGVGYKKDEFIDLITFGRRDLVKIVKLTEDGEILYLNPRVISAGLPGKYSAIGGSLLRFSTNLQNAADIYNEVWGEFVKPGKTRVFKIRYAVDGFYYQKSEDRGQSEGLLTEKSEDRGQKSEDRFDTYDNIDKYRRGVLMYE